MRKRRSRPIKRSRMASWWMLWRVPALLAIVSAAWWFIYRPYVEERGWVIVTSDFAMCGEPWQGANGCVVDGDTLVIGNGEARRRIRLTGFNAPELDGACEAETGAARRAKRALHEWLDRGAFEWSGEADPPRDQYGRELREARRQTGENRYDRLADHMIRQDLASESGWGATSVDWCAES